MRTFFVVIAGLIAGGAVASIAKAQSQASPTPAMTIEFEERLTHPGAPSPMVAGHRIATYRADGASAELKRVQRKDNQTTTTVDIQLPGGITARSYPEIKSFVSLKLPNREASLAMGRYTPASDCAVRPDGLQPRQVLGEDKIFDVRVVKFVDDYPSSTMTVWAAPTLGCIVIQRLAIFKHPNGGSDTSELVPVKIEPGKTRDELFVVPADFELVDDGEILNRTYLRATGKPAPEQAKASMKQAISLFPTHKFDFRTQAK